VKSKTQQMLQLLQAGEVKKALAIAKTFRMGFTREEQKVIQRGYECLVHPEFYIKLGRDCQECTAQALTLLQTKYHKETV